MKTKRHKSPRVLSLLLVILFSFAGCDSRQPPPPAPPDVAEMSQHLRDAAIRLLRDKLSPAGATSTAAVTDTKELALPGGWSAEVKFYAKGTLLGEGNGASDVLSNALLSAMDALKKNLPADSQNAQSIQQGRFFVTLVWNGKPGGSFVEYNGKGLEVVGGDLVAVREVNTNLLRKQIALGREYLLRIMNKDKHAFFKRFDATTGAHDTRLRTIYTASSLYTLLKMNDLSPDPAVEELIPQIAAFLLSMQNNVGEFRGAFHYSINSTTGEKEKSFVVGTASKTIYTLLELYRRTNDPKYLKSAQAAGDWLLTMQKSDGTIVNSVHFKKGLWVRNEKFSTLYLGQVISALSRLYGATRDKRYLHGAEVSADVLLRRAKQMNYFMRDDFRLSDDPIPTTWAVQSLLDFYKVTKNPAVKDACLQCANVVLKRQYVDPNDVAEYGRFEGTYATSGNGWINEVFMELYQYGKSEGWVDIEPFRTAAIRVTRWLVQNTYSPENTYFLPHGPAAVGGLIRSYREESVRTDAVCHGSNGCALLLSCTEPGVLLTLPETQPLLYETQSN